MAGRAAPIVGIDLGTTFSVVSALDAATGRPFTIPNEHGDRTTPSVVLFDEDGGLVVGKEAQRVAPVEPGRVAECPKRDMGRPLYHRPVAGRRVAPELLSAAILRRLKADDEHVVGPFREVVVTVPAYFDHTRREATVAAGRLAELDVVEVLNEPTAAALAYGHQKGFLGADGVPMSDAPTARSGMLTVLVYDLGGGTFDVTVMQIKVRHFKTLATDGDVRLGGRDWDRRVVDHAAAAHLDAHPGADPRKDPETLQALYQVAEAAKRALSTLPRTRLTFHHRGAATTLELTRATFDELTADLLERTRVTTRLVLAEAGLAWPDVDRVLLSGGSTRMPQVAAMLRDLTGREPDRTLSPDEAVAHGAALYHGLLRAAQDGKGPDPAAAVINVNAHSLGVFARRRDGPALRPYNSILLPRNTPLPHAGRREYRTVKDDQRGIIVRLLEGESLDPFACAQLGEFRVEPLPPGLPAGTPVEIRYSYNRGGRIQVAASVQTAEGQLEVRIGHQGRTRGLDAEEWVAQLLSSLS
jgi:molecular chaperone DnaK